jgi:hypothetical protein
MIANIFKLSPIKSSFLNMTVLYKSIIGHINNLSNIAFIQINFYVRFDVKNCFYRTSLFARMYACQHIPKRLSLVFIVCEDFVITQSAEFTPDIDAVDAARCYFLDILLEK